MSPLCPNLILIGPGCGSSWQAPGFTSSVEPIFRLLKEQHVILMKPLDRYKSMSKRDKRHFDNPASKVEFITKNLDYIASLLRATMSLNHAHRFMGQSGYSSASQMSYSEGPDDIEQQVGHMVPPIRQHLPPETSGEAHHLVSRAVEQLSQLKMKEPNTSSAQSDEKNVRQTCLVTQRITALDTYAHDQPLNTMPSTDDEASSKLASLPGSAASASYFLSCDLSYLQLSVREQAQTWEEQVEKGQQGQRQG